MMNKMINKIKQIYKRKKDARLKNKYIPFVAKKLEKILVTDFTSQIPIMIVSYNNGVYVQNFCKQLKCYGHKPIVIDNASTDKSTKDILSQLEQNDEAYVVDSEMNFGHMVGFLHEIYEVLPEVFAYSDPDLELNPDLPSDFLDVLSKLAQKYKVYKAGFALPSDIGEPLFDKKVTVHRESPFSFSEQYNITEWESRFWRFQLPHDSLEIYAATIDTTFAVYHKSNYFGNFEDAIRVGGEFGALHLPWFENLDLFNEENREKYQSGNLSTNWT